MYKRLLSIAALICLTVSCANAAAETLMLPANDADVLSLFFPGQTFTTLPDFYYTSEPVPEGYAQYDIYGNRNVYKINEVKRFGEQLLIVVEGHGMAHSEGYRNMLFGVYDLARGGLAGEPLSCVADSAAYALFNRDGAVNVQYAGVRIYQGHESYVGGRWAWNGSAWTLAWPANMDARSEAYTAFWENRKCEIAYETPGSMALYTRVIDNRDAGFVVPEYHWELEGYMNIFQ